MSVATTDREKKKMKRYVGSQLNDSRNSKEDETKVGEAALALVICKINCLQHTVINSVMCQKGQLTSVLDGRYWKPDVCFTIDLTRSLPHFNLSSWKYQSTWMVTQIPMKFRKKISLLKILFCAVGTGQQLSSNYKEVGYAAGKLLKHLRRSNPRWFDSQCSKS